MTYKVPFVDIRAHYKKLKREIDPVMQDVLTRGDIILRKDLEYFEKSIARFVGTRYAIGVGNGFDALHLSVKATGIGPGHEVITVAHTFVATVAAIVHHGGTPVLADVKKDFTMDPDALAGAITKKTKAVIPVHLNGRLCEMDRIMEIARKHKLIVIEDAAQSLGASFKGKKAGSFGVTGCFSLYPFKMLGCFGDGGIITTDNARMAQKLRWLRDHGQDRATGRIMFYGFNSRLDNLHAATLNVKLKHFKKWVARRQKIAALYNKGLRSITEIALPHFSDPRYEDVYQNYVIRAHRRDKLKKYLSKHGVETLISWPKPMHFHSPLRLRHFKLPETEKLYKEALSLPMNPELSDEQVNYVIQTTRNFYHSSS